MTKYTYTKDVVVARLELEIKASSIVYALDHIAAFGTSVDVYFKAELSAEDVSTLNGIVAAHLPIPIPDANQTVELDELKSNAGRLLVETCIHTGPPGSKSVSLCSHDWGDRTAWYQKSVQVVDEVLTDTGDGRTFTSSNPWWINIYNDRLTFTHKQIPRRDGSFGKHDDWKTIVKVNDVIQTGGYVVNFIDGKVVFADSQSGKTIKVTYWHNNIANHSEFLIVPPPGKKYVVEHVEMQFSNNTTFSDCFRFEIWAGAMTGNPKAVNVAAYGGFIEPYYEAGYGQFRADYRCARDLINAANQGQGTIPAIGELTQEVCVMPFNYIQAFTLDSAAGALFRCCLINDTAFINTEIATATFYLQILPS